MAKLSGKATLSKKKSASLLKKVYYKRKNLGAKKVYYKRKNLVANSFLFRALFSEDCWCAGNKQEVTKVVSLVSNGGKSTNCIMCP